MDGGYCPKTAKYFVIVLCCVSSFLKVSLCQLTIMTSSDSIPRLIHGRPRAQSKSTAISSTRGRELISRKDDVAFISNATQFVQALADQTVERIVLSAAYVDLSYKAWNSSGVSLPVPLNRNITIEGDPSFAEWPLLNINNVKGVARLAGGCSLTFRNLVLMYFREQPTRVFGVDFLLPTLPGGISVLFVDSAVLFEGLCFPVEFRTMDFNSVPRPSQFPGNQSFIATVPQDGCINDTSVHPLRRCWAARGYIFDVATTCADIDPLTQSTNSINQILRCTNTTGICEHEVDEYCLYIEQKEPFVCFLETKMKYDAARKSKVPVNTEDEEHNSGAGLRGRSRVAVISATTIGGSLVVIIIVIGLAAAVSWRRHGGRAVIWRDAFATRNGNGSSSTLDGAKLASEHGITKGGRGGDNNEGQQEAAGSNMDPESAALPAGHQLEDIPVTLLTPPRAEVVLRVQVAQQQKKQRQQPGTDSHDTHSRKVELLPTVLGKGSSGRVVQGLYHGRRVAVKLMTSDALWEQAGQQENIQQHQQEEQQKSAGLSNIFMQNFVQEVLSRCQHPNIVQLVAACVTPPRLCLVMELMETSLERFLYGNTSLNSTEHIPLDKVLWIGIGISNALAYLHPTIMHRDLKPANVLINDATSDKPIVKLTDFGLSRLRMTVRSTKHPDAGTPPYMAPECFDLASTRITHQSDIYSLGVMLWEMLAGRRPWDGMTGVAIAFMVTYKEARLPVDGLAPSRCPPKLTRLLRSCWDVDPVRRPAAAEVAKELTLIMNIHEARN
ncbi:hypothetical protein Vafri_21405 [Volvox africanus]|uniref:Protein kinase domain-containing protein n=1 Tax=Volvox africanus TaxID=51714 RepID=A0A8J4FBB1_9CHLO|nr:hypothetical protein Vafri_21405 [Volvox africanus]